MSYLLFPLDTIKSTAICQFKLLSVKNHKKASKEKYAVSTHVPSSVFTMIKLSVKKNYMKNFLFVITLSREGRHLSTFIYYIVSYVFAVV